MVNVAERMVRLLLFKDSGEFDVFFLFPFLGATESAIA